MEKQNISCPNCGHLFNVEDVFYKEIELEQEKKYQQKLKAAVDTVNQKEVDLKQREQKLEENRKRENELFQERLNKKLAALKKEEAERATKEVSLKIDALEKEAQEKSVLVLELQKKEVEFMQQQKLMEAERESREVELQKKLLKQQNEIEQKARLKERENFELKEKEYQKKLEDQLKLVEEMKRKSEQGSTQLQGEVQELAIEEWLKIQFPLDEIKEIKKGVRGGDCIQNINTRTLTNCGKIYYESKRTQNFGGDWIEKFKQDMRSKKIDVGVIVTKTMPKDMPRMGLKDGIWICTFKEFKGLSTALREGCIKVAGTLASQENKGDKMEMLYNYLTGKEFKMQIEAIIEGFSALKEGIDKEKRAMQSIWKQREKQLEKVLLSTTSFYGSIKGIAGSALPTIDYLELPGGDTDDENDNTLFD